AVGRDGDGAERGAGAIRQSRHGTGGQLVSALWNVREDKRAVRPGGGRRVNGGVAGSAGRGADEPDLNAGQSRFAGIENAVRVAVDERTALYGAEDGRHAAVFERLQPWPGASRMFADLGADRQ